MIDEIGGRQEERTEWNASWSVVDRFCILHFAFDCNGKGGLPAIVLIRLIAGDVMGWMDGWIC